MKITIIAIFVIFFAGVNSLPTPNRSRGGLFGILDAAKEFASDVSDKVINTASDVSDKVINTASNISDKVINTASNISDKVINTASNVSDKVKNTADKLNKEILKPILEKFKNFNIAVWDEFKKAHKRRFSCIENEIEHLKNFAEHFTKITKHNELFKKGKVLFRRAVNKFTDMSQKQFIIQTNGFIKGLVERNTAKRDNRSKFRAYIPDSIDWREKGVNTSVRDQDACASCWSFAAAAAIEAHERIKNGRELELSEQNFVDCAKSIYNAGCMGGHPLYAYNYTLKNEGVSLNMYYPYEGVKRSCRYKRVFNAGTYSIAYKRLPPGDEEAIKEAVATVGPVVAGIDGTLDSLRDYDGGIYYDEECSSDAISHAVLIVGYGTEKGVDYWIIKNSLGKYWGEKGYLRLARNQNNHCGIATDASYPILRSNTFHRF